MKLLAIAAAGLVTLHAQPVWAQPASAPRASAQAAPSEALIDRFIAAIPDAEEIAAAPTGIDAAELGRLVALNPGKEAQLRSILQANLACSGPAVTAGTLRMLRTIARDLGAERLQKLISFYEGPDYAAFEALAARMQGKAAPSAADEAALAKLTAAYPLRAFLDRMNNAQAIIEADQGFMTAAMNCASQQVDALTAAGLKAN
jgi:hypothetical protein